MIAANAPAVPLPGRTTSLAIPLLEGISIEVSALRGGGWLTAFKRRGEMIAEDRSAALPWIDRYGAGRLTNLLCDKVPLDKRAVKAALQEVFSTVKTSPDAPGLTSTAVARVISETESVQIELSDRPVYIVTLEGGRSLTFSAKEIAAHRAISLNETWLSVHPRGPLNASGADFEEIIEYWLSIAEEVEPAGDMNPWESIAEKLQIRIAACPVGKTKEGLAGAGLYQEENGPLWITNRIIQEVLRDAGRDVNDSGFSRYLQSIGVLVSPSKSFRVLGLVGRAWGFRPDFKPEDAKITDLATLPDEPEEARP